MSSQVGVISPMSMLMSVQHEIITYAPHTVVVPIRRRAWSLTVTVSPSVRPADAASDQMTRNSATDDDGILVARPQTRCLCRSSPHLLL